jgi:hypothetical protein
VTAETPWEYKSRWNQSKIEIVSVERELFGESFGGNINAPGLLIWVELMRVVQGTEKSVAFTSDSTDLFYV